MRFLRIALVKKRIKTRLNPEKRGYNKIRKAINLPPT